MNNGLDCVDQILGFYGRQDDLNGSKLKIWLSNTLIKLMKNLHEKQDYIRIRNCLLLLINLFLNEGKDFDYLDELGTSSTDLTAEQHILLCDLLKSEFHLDYN